MNVVKKNTICPAGDVIVKLVETKHVAFRRAGVDLHSEVTITLREALLGFERSLGAQTFWYGILWKNAGQMRISPWRNWEFHLEKLGLNLKRMVSLPCKTHILARQDKKKGTMKHWQKRWVWQSNLGSWEISWGFLGFWGKGQCSSVAGGDQCMGWTELKTGFWVCHRPPMAIILFPLMNQFSDTPKWYWIYGYYILFIRSH